MPRHSKNTERGSKVKNRKRQHRKALRELLTHKLQCPGVPVSLLAREHALQERCAQRRWKAFEKARATGRSEKEALKDAVADKRGGQNRAFTPAHEKLLGDIVRAAQIATPANVGTKITFPTITASGEKLPMCAILKGKTPRCLKKVQTGASADVKKVKLYFSQKGWVNEGIMALYLRDVLVPFTHGNPAALIIDSYKAHFTPAIRDAAAAMNLQLIQVPGGCTADLQPLDASFNGPLLMKRKHIWAQKKLPPLRCGLCSGSN
jgi:hypothetical protein